MSAVHEHRVEAPELRERLLHFINHALPQLDRRARTWTPVSAETPLFETGLLDSLSILHLIGAVEELTGREVPEQLVVMKHFRSVEAIGAAFAQPTQS